MFPIIFQIGPIRVYSYGLMLALAVVVGTFLLVRHAKRVGLDGERMMDLVFWVVLGGVIGSRLFFVLLNLPYFLQSPVEIVMLQKGGLAWQGGVILGGLSGWFFLKKNKLPLWKVLDLVAPYLALGQAIGRIGCLLNGCCFGRPVSWGLYFPVHQARLHPTQMYLTGGFLAVFFVLRRYQEGRLGTGRVFVLYIFLASAWRFIVEFFRADHYHFFLGLSVFQWMSLGFMMMAGLVAWRRTRQAQGHGRG